MTDAVAAAEAVEFRERRRQRDRSDSFHLLLGAAEYLDATSGSGKRGREEYYAKFDSPDSVTTLTADDGGVSPSFEAFMLPPPAVLARAMAPPPTARKTTTTSPTPRRKPVAAPASKKVTSDARRAETFLNYVRDTENPTGEAFRRLVSGINDTKRSSRREELFGMKQFDARPKYVLRKLVFSIVPAKTKDRIEYIRNELKLPSVPTEQRLCTKQDAFSILMAVCDHRPDHACIPDSLRCRS